jgi:hypothetical protein
MWRSLVSAPALGAGGRRFESGHPDQFRAYVDLVLDLPGSQSGSHVLSLLLSLLTGCRSEEARALTWGNVELVGDPDAEPPVPPPVAVWRLVRSHGDVKTKKSRRRSVCPWLPWKY